MVTLKEQAEKEAKEISAKYNIIYFAILKKEIDKELDRRLATQ